MGDELAAAAVQLRPPPGDPLRAALVRPPPRPDDDPLMTSSSSALTTGDPGHGVAEQNPVGGLAHDVRGGISNPILGMILFICSEVMFFSGLFAAYFSVRASTVPWPPGPPAVPVEIAERFNLHAEPWFAGILTLI